LLKSPSPQVWKLPVAHAALRGHAAQLPIDPATHPSVYVCPLQLLQDCWEQQAFSHEAASLCSFLQYRMLLSAGTMGAQTLPSTATSATDAQAPVNVYVLQLALDWQQLLCEHCSPHIVAASSATCVTASHALPFDDQRPQF